MNRILFTFVLAMLSTICLRPGSAVGAGGPHMTFSKTANPTSGFAPLTVEYTYTYDNTHGKTWWSVKDLHDDKCKPIAFSGGDSNSNGLVDVGEIWTWSCTTVLNTTTTNTASADVTQTSCSDDGTCTTKIVDFTQASATVTILPSAPSVTISGALSACIGTTVTLTGVATGGTAPYTYLWSNQATSQAITPSTSVAGTFPFSLTVTDQSGKTASANVTLSVALVCLTQINEDGLQRPPELPILTTIEWGCGWSFAGVCLRQTIVKICVGGQCHDTLIPPKPPICSGIFCDGIILGTGALMGLIAGLVLVRVRRRYRESNRR